MINIWHFSDTHGNHRLINVPVDIDIAVFSGDAGTYRNSAMNEPIVKDFIDWYSELPIDTKIYVAGNHDSSIEQRLVTADNFKEKGIIYLENEALTICQKGIEINFWGSPFTPSFGQWSFMKSRSKLHKIWSLIPNNTDILITHGPPKGILDLAPKYGGELEMCGCANLRKKVEEIEPDFHFFGHIHDNVAQQYNNAGVKRIANLETIFSNASACRDGDMNNIHFNGNIVTYEGN